MPDETTADAHGRVNLLGEHTDYHHGHVLPTLVPLRVRAQLRRRSDRIVHAASTAAAPAHGSYLLGTECRDGTWLDYVQGATALLTREGATIGGFELEVRSSVPIGAGLSSSAALTIAVLRGLRSLFDLAVDDMALALTAHAVEVDFVGVPVGRMDPIACALGRDGEAMFLDTATLRIERVAIPPSVSIAVIVSGVTHQHAGGAYAQRRRESFDAAQALGVSYLCEVGVDQLGRLDRLAATLRKRARHVITEHARVLEAVDAMRRDDPAGLGRLFTASHESLRDDYEVSTPEIDRLVAIAASERGVYGARLTGGGFGGAVIVAMEPGGRADVIASRYSRETGRPGKVVAVLPDRTPAPGRGEPSGGY
jgi:galactokinase